MTTTAGMCRLDEPVPYTLTPRGHAALDDPRVVDTVPVVDVALITARAPVAAPWIVRADVLTLAREVDRLRGLLNAGAVNGPGRGEWGCALCGAAYLGTRPDDGLCPDCRDNS
jgi:hypothetical protein